MQKNLRRLLITKNIFETESLLHCQPYDIAQELKNFSFKEQIILLDSFPVKKSAKILKYIGLKEKYKILYSLPEEKAKIILNSQPVDDLVDLFLTVRLKQDEQLMKYLNNNLQEKILELMQFKPGTAGSLVTSEYLSARESWLVREALEYIRQYAIDVESISYIYVLDNNEQLKGTISIRELLLANDNDTLSKIMIQDVIAVHAEIDQYEVVKKLTNYNLSALPVITTNNVMIGIVTFDDVMDIIEDEATEDIQKLGGSKPLNQPYFEASIWSIFYKRIPWLLLLFVAEAYTGTVLKVFEDQIEAVVALAFFIPLLVGTGGNTGTQVVATIIRAVGIGEVAFKDIFRVIKKEVLIGILLGVTLGIAGLIRAHLLGVGTEVALVVAITMIFIVIWSSIVAAALPLFLRKLKLDPAVVSGPFITTFVDGTGLVIYFMIAKMLLNI
ncbi:magnesium transporter [Bacillus cereus]|uniref:magnesium transporter n=1 Tax=Bacillus cereus TaxID=1396 RepID=UPI000BF2D3C3|nr:magnesium transporter [Bacillus cereus]PFA64063.1 magnesium transporter [Bacillus cereus]